VGADCPLDWKWKGLSDLSSTYQETHPVLLYKSNSKLMFPLSCVFADTMTKAIVHTDEERCIVGAWVVDEVRKAVEMVCFVGRVGILGIFCNVL